VSDWEIIRHAVAITGRVIDLHTKRAIPDAQVQLIDAPEKFIVRVITIAKIPSLAGAPEEVMKERAKLDDPGKSLAEKLNAAQAIIDYLQGRSRKSGMNGRPDQLRTMADGHFHFLDLPGGDYTLEVTLPTAIMRYGKAQAVVSVIRDSGGNITEMGTAEIELPSNAVKGQITKPNPDGEDPPVIGVAMAEIRLKGSRERTFSDGEGNYLLAALEKGERSLEFSAMGFQAALRTVQLNEGETVPLDVELQLAV
jgi:Carboxypeptidase regulatory-like domain